MAEPEGIDELRARLRRVEDDAAAARHLAAGADRDVAEVRVELREFRAEVRAEFADVRREMGDFKSEMRGFRDGNNRVLSAMRADLTDLRNHVDNGFAEMRGLLDGQAAFNSRIADMLDVLIRRGDERSES